MSENSSNEVKDVVNKVETEAKSIWKKAVGVVAVLAIAAGALFSDCGNCGGHTPGVTDGGADIAVKVDAAVKATSVDAGTAVKADAAAKSTDASK